MRFLAITFVLAGFAIASGLLFPQSTAKQQTIVPSSSRIFTNFQDFNRRHRRFRVFLRRCASHPRHTRTFDGYCNNPFHPMFGAADRVYGLYARRNVFDPVTSKLPSPRVVSNAIHAIGRNPPLSPNRRGLSEMATCFGQFIDHTITETENSKETWPIPIPANDPFFKGSVMGFFRTHKINGVPVNLLPSFIDASSIYGGHTPFARSLRSYKGGKLKTSAGNMLTFDSRNFFVSGDKRVNENPVLTALHTLFTREHNRLCDEIAAAVPHYNDELLYHAARQIVIAEIQAITYYEFLPAVVGHFPRYRGYHRRVNAHISNEFSTVAFRVGHTMINPAVTFLNANGVRSSMPLRRAFFSPSVIAREGIDSLLRGSIKTKAAEIDVYITDEVRNFLHGSAPNAPSLDLASLNIQRGRDHSMASYNDMRHAFRLKRVHSFSQITRNAGVAARLKYVYGNVNNIDAWVGGLAEDHHSNSALGPLFRNMWIREFQKLRHGDRFYFERLFQYPREVLSRVKTAQDLLLNKSLRGGILRFVIAANTDIPAFSMKRNVFYA